MSSTAAPLFADTTTDSGEHAEIWIDHHRVAHERNPHRYSWTWCDSRIVGSDAPTHARLISVVGCRACVIARLHANAA
ncbi:hypothetical protein GCM10011581_47600 [Saccharopolyspora subtropica]|uniref:Uncharacterized protein n=1 Tax=Saccharopolyspora thermophila TaxID=89367 RepID=A0A917KBI5_9PSEU|nr:hypothetical protein [Saccharopolyspora subtropica]GGJ05002.1 hypothetical protein GCM10011581_47600 [Saccharopolyspora subtropica]